MGWIEIPLGLLIVATETGPLIEVADPSPKAVVTLLTVFDILVLVYFGYLTGSINWRENGKGKNLTIKI